MYRNLSVLKISAQVALGRLKLTDPGKPRTHRPSHEEDSCQSSKQTENVQQINNTRSIFNRVQQNKLQIITEKK